MNPSAHSADESAIRSVLDAWTRATREGRLDDVLTNHDEKVLIYDVLPPMKYSSASEYRKTWDEWQPDAQGEMRFELEGLEVTVGTDAAFAYGILQCGGTLLDGKAFRDTVRATFCFSKKDGKWKVVHQHISKPYDRG
ncbi:MAG: nuclear transport factor 2 family protein [Chromatiaceae bacterium]|nr:nuclear transport factor 2 family protein [Chromatiaceae bacterium]